MFCPQCLPALNWPQGTPCVCHLRWEARKARGPCITWGPPCGMSATAPIPFFFNKYNSRLKKNEGRAGALRLALLERGARVMTSPSLRRSEALRTPSWRRSETRVVGDGTRVSRALPTRPCLHASTCPCASPHACPYACTQKPGSSATEHGSRGLYPRARACTLPRVRAHPHTHARTHALTGAHARHSPGLSI